MNDQTKQSTAQKGAQKYFKKESHDDDTLGKQARKKERAAGAAKTAKLRALRLAKEAADKDVADKQAAENGGKVPAAKRKRAAAAKPAGMVRMSY
jgi:hypothetical protein